MTDFRNLERRPAQVGPVQRRRGIALVAVVAGTALIAATLRVQRDSTAFYVAGYALALVWVVATVLSRPIQLRGSTFSLRAELGIGAIAGGLMFGVFVAADVIGRHFAALAGPIDRVLAKADSGAVLAVLALALINGVAEEVFFRGALTVAIGGRFQLVVSTVVYIVVTALAGNIALTLAAIVMGIVFAIERAVTHGVIASIVTHVVWSTLVVLALPR